MSGYSRNPVHANQRFGRLTTVSESGRSNDGHKIWMCVCDCGTSVLRQTNSLRSGGLKHCGCANAELSRIHGMRGTPTYGSWVGAKGRCFNLADKSYQHYGGRGITMCDRWKDSFQSFLEDMGEKPNGLSLERKDVNGNYEPSNCVWATATQQARNKRKSTYVFWRGSRRHLSEVAEQLGITFGAAFMRLKRGQLNDHL